MSDLTQSAMAELEAIRRLLASGLQESADALELGRTPAAAVMESHRLRGVAIRTAGARIALLLTHIEESAPPAPPARPLEAVLTDIEAEGHDWRLEGPNYPSRDSGYFIATKRADKPHEDAAAEGGRVYGARNDALAVVAEERLAHIRKLHADRAAAVAAVERDQASDAEAMGFLGTLGIAPSRPVVFHYGPIAYSQHVIDHSPDYPGSARYTDAPDLVTCASCLEWIARNVPPAPEEPDSEHEGDPAVVEAWVREEPEQPAGGRVIHVTANVAIEDGQDGRYKVGRVDMDFEPWWVVDCAPNASPISVCSFDTEDQAKECRDALNAGDAGRAYELQRQQQLRRDAREAAESGEED